MKKPKQALFTKAQASFGFAFEPWDATNGNHWIEYRVRP